MAKLLDNEKVPASLLDFRNFLFLFWQFLNLPEPTVRQYEMAEYVQNGPRRRMVKGYRGIGKSYITSAYVLWRLKLNPQLKILVLSANKERATAFTTFTKRAIDEWDLLAELRAESNQRNSVVAFDVGPSVNAHAPSVKSVGIFGQMTGSRADIIVLDDIEVPNNSDTQTSRTKLRERSKEIEAVGSPDHEVVILCTDQSEDSVYRGMHAKYIPKMWPAKYPKREKLEKYGDWLADSIYEEVMMDPSVAGTPTDPLRYDEEELAQREAIYGPSGFALQFMLDPSLEDDFKYPLRVKDLIIHPVDKDNGPEGLIWTNLNKHRLDELPNLSRDGDYFYGPADVMGDYIPWVGSVMGIDPSGKGKDELSFTIAKGLNGFIHIPVCRGLKGGYEEDNLRHIAEVCEAWGVHLVLVEQNFGQGMFGELLKPYLQRYAPGCGIELRPVNVQKEKRIIQTLEPVMAQHRLVIDPRVIQEDYETGPSHTQDDGISYRLIHQMSHITMERGCLKHDDRLDSMEIAVSWFTQAAAQDAKKRMQMRRQRLEKEDDRIFLEHQTDRKWRKPGSSKRQPKLLRKYPR